MCARAPLGDLSQGQFFHSQNSGRKIYFTLPAKSVEGIFVQCSIGGYLAERVLDFGTRADYFIGEYPLFSLVISTPVVADPPVAVARAFGDNNHSSVAFKKPKSKHMVYLEKAKKLDGNVLTLLCGICGKEEEGLVGELRAEI